MVNGSSGHHLCQLLGGVGDVERLNEIVFVKYKKRMEPQIPKLMNNILKPSFSSLFIPSFSSLFEPFFLPNRLEPPAFHSQSAVPGINRAGKREY